MTVISYNFCYEDGISKGARPRVKSLAASVDFFGYPDVFFSLAEKETFT